MYARRYFLTLDIFAPLSKRFMPLALMADDATREKKIAKWNEVGLADLTRVKLRIEVMSLVGTAVQLVSPSVHPLPYIVWIGN